MCAQDTEEEKRERHSRDLESEFSAGGAGPGGDTTLKDADSSAAQAGSRQHHHTGKA